MSTEWRPDDALAALTGLQALSEQQQLCIRHPSDWQHLAQLTALLSLVGAEYYCAPAEQPATVLQLLELTGFAYLHEYDLGRVLLACPLLKEAKVVMSDPPAPMAAQPVGGARLPPHPSLRHVTLGYSREGNADAAARFAALAPVLGGVECLELLEWPHGGRAGGLPDLSPCTALTALEFECEDPEDSEQLPAEQEAYLSMLAPLVGLRSLVLSCAPRLTARVAIPLQYILPQLQTIHLKAVDVLLPEDDDVDVLQHQQAEVEALRQVVQLLRHGLRLTLTA